MKKYFCSYWAVFLIFIPLSGFGLEGSAAVYNTVESADTAENHSQQEPQRDPAQKRFKIKTAVTMATTDVTVVGTDVPELRAEDFVIYDNGIEHPASHFSRNKLPLAVALLIDTSLTVEPYLPVLQIAAGSALRNLKPDDMVVLYSFDANPRRLSNLTYDRVEIAKKISKLKFKLGTNIYDTINDAAGYLQKNAPNHRRAFIMISDNFHVRLGFARYEDNSAERASYKALEAAATLYSIKTPSIGTDVTGSVHQVERIAVETGGEILNVQGWTSLQAAIEEVVLKLRMQYTLGFNPSELGEDGSFHKLEVKFADKDRCPDCRILARSGYYAGIPPPVPSLDKKQEKPKRTQAETDQLLIQQSILTAGTTDANLTDLPLKIKADRFTDPNGASKLEVKVHIDAERVKFKMVEGRHACRLHIAVFYAKENLKILGSEWQIIEGQLKEETYRKALKTGIMHSAMIPLKTEKQVINVVVYDEYSDRVGSQLIRKLSEYQSGSK